MRVRAIDSSGDWVFGQGRSSYFNGAKEIMQDIDTALQLFLGEAFWQMDAGVDWWNLIGGKNPQAQQNIILQCRQVIASRWGVTKITSVDATFTDYRRSLSIVYKIDTIYGSQSSSISKGFTL
jgi:hypothetical protein